MCLYPTLVPNKKYTITEKNGGIIPPFYDDRVLAVPRKCGNCMECLKQKAREWQVRLMEDIKVNKGAKFITLTFSNESIKHLNEKIALTKVNKYGKEQPIEGYLRDNMIATKGVRLFLERWRKIYGKSPRHFLITELGHNGTENIHLHGFIWTKQSFKEIREIWNYGFIWPKPSEEVFNTVNEITINYIIKYIHKMDKDHPNYKSIILNSPGIGGNYVPTASYDYCEQYIHFNPKTRQWSLRVRIKQIKVPIYGQWLRNRFNGEDTIETYKTKTGHEIAMPIYWRNKIYNEYEREKLWINKLDKNERWINGEKIDVSNGVEEYYAVLKWHQERNKRLGYGSDTKNWKQAEYEKQRRKYLLDKRINNTASGGVIKRERINGG